MEEGTKQRKPEALILNILLLGIVVFGLGFLGGLAAIKYGGNSAITQNIRKSITIDEQSAVIDVANKVEPSVVSITSEQSRLNFFGRIQSSKAYGTGFIVSKDGLIITNKHVVDASANYSVFTSDGKEYQARVVAKDSIYDIAFVKIEAKNLTPVELGDSNELKVGQEVIAIGNALGQFQNTVTTGIVSAVGRAIEAADSQGSSETLDNLIQTDAAINPGNSGGPLVNIDGQVIGINTAVSSEGQGIGFAIPINVAKAAIKSVEEKGKIVRPMIGIRYVNITKEFASRNTLSVGYGALIYTGTDDPAVLPGTPAAKVGLQENDIITKLNDTQISEGKSLAGILANYLPGDKVTITYLRNNKEHRVDVTLAESGS